MIKIIGDVMLDMWTQGDCQKVSPEAPVLVVKETNKDFNVGGAGNLALNLSNLGTDTWLYGGQRHTRTQNPRNFTAKWSKVASVPRW